jgi:hypothetical protein
MHEIAAILKTDMGELEKKINNLKSQYKRKSASHQPRPPQNCQNKIYYEPKWQFLKTSVFSIKCQFICEVKWNIVCFKLLTLLFSILHFIAVVVVFSKKSVCDVFIFAPMGRPFRVKKPIPNKCSTTKVRLLQEVKISGSHGSE